MVKHQSNEGPDVALLLEALGQQGLERREGGTPEGAAAPKKAILAVSGGNVRPTLTVNHRDPGAREQVDTLWHQEAERLKIFDQNGEFLLLATYPGSLAKGWLRMKDSVGNHLPSRIAAATGYRDFIAVSLDGKSLCAVSVEEYEDWIVTHSFEDARPKVQ
ncbi:hypothetical protein ACQI4E_13865 [Streptomyces sp. CA-252508]|uniref:hypothetical protein n=1 Tax=Streptomyces sp. CA-252508 TaxID=3418946 RepID=UPI003D900222